MTQHFLIEHDRHWKIPTRITIYDDLDQVNGRLDTLENEQLAELNACLKAGRPVRMEYVVLGAASLATIKRTHGRYFGGDYEVVTSVESSGSAARGQRSQQTPEESRSVEAKAFADALTAP